MASYIDASDSIGDGPTSSSENRDLYHRLCVDADVWMQDEIKGVDSRSSVYGPSRLIARRSDIAQYLDIHSSFQISGKFHPLVNRAC
jgi:hypothetical protein